MTQCKLSEDDLVLSLGFIRVSGLIQVESSSEKVWTFWKGAYEGVAFTIYFKETEMYCTLVLLFSMAHRSNLTPPPVLAYLLSSNTKGGPSLD